jgi:adenylate cyclase
VDTDELVEAGLYDPTAPDAAERLDLLEYLVGRGATIAQMSRADRDGRLPALAGDLVLFPRRTERVQEVAERLGWSREKLARLHLAMGLPFDEEQGIAPDLVRAFEIFDVGAALFGEQALLQFARVLGASAARVAESALSLFLTEVERPTVGQSQADCARLSRANGTASDALLLVPEVIAALLPEHLERAIRRQRADTGATGGQRDRRNLTVGFVDLVDFTARSSHLDPNELADVLGRFETLAWDSVVRNDGRVVKMIGDEVMFVATDAGAACAAALAICGEVEADPALLAVRAGLAYGQVTTWGADVFGPVVNLAARLTAEVGAGQVVATPAVAALVAPDDHRWEFHPLGRRELRGFDEPVELLEVVRGAGEVT